MYVPFLVPPIVRSPPHTASTTIPGGSTSISAGGEKTEQALRGTGWAKKAVLAYVYIMIYVHNIYFCFFKQYIYMICVCVCAKQWFMHNVVLFFGIGIVHLGFLEPSR